MINIGIKHGVSLRKHAYSNILKISPETSTHNLCFWAEIRKIMYIPVNPSFSTWKWGLRGSKLYRDAFVMHALTFVRSRGRCLKPRPKAAVFNTSLGTGQILMHWKTMLDRYYCIKTENVCYILRYFLHYFVSSFHRCLANVISTDYASSRVGQYTSRNGSKSVALVRSYWKLRSRALTASELPC